MRERPLSITILSWCFLIITLPSLAGAIAPAHHLSTNGLGLPPGAVQMGKAILDGVTALCCIAILKGNPWARSCFTVTLVLELLRIVLLGRRNEMMLFHADMSMCALAIWVLYRPLGRAYFLSEEAAPPLFWQSGTALCYMVTTFSMMLAMGMPSGIAFIGEKALYWTLLLAFFAVATYGVGNALGLVLNPMRDVGSILVFAAVAQLLFVIGTFLNIARSIEAARHDGDPVPNVNLWISCVVTAIFVALGVSLIRRSRLAGKVSPAETLENTDAAGNL